VAKSDFAPFHCRDHFRICIPGHIRNLYPASHVASGYLCPGILRTVHFRHRSSQILCVQKIRIIAIEGGLLRAICPVYKANCLTDIGTSFKRSEESLQTYTPLLPGLKKYLCSCGFRRALSLSSIIHLARFSGERIPKAADMRSRHLFIKS